jgi:adenylate kinase family enzyme
MKIAFCGYAGVGKTTAANFLVRNFGYTKLSFANAVKEKAKELFPDLEFIKPYTKCERRLLIAIGNSIRSVNNQYWVRLLEEKLDEIESKDIVIDDVRFLVEEKFLRRKGFLIVRIDVPEDKHKEIFLEDLNTKVFESEVLKIQPHKVIVNDKTKSELFHKVVSVLRR